MQAYLVDTWYLIAALAPDDQHHLNAERIARRLQGVALVSHDAVFHELLAYFCEDGRRMRQLAVDSVRRFRRGSLVLESNRDLFDRALVLYESRADKEYSLVDCMSMVVMRDRGITHVLTNDHHFSQEGFTLVNE